MATIRGNWDEALRATEHRIALDPKSPHAHVTRGYLLWWMANPEPALLSLQTALCLDPKNPSDAVVVLFGWVEFMRGNYGSAIHWASKAQAANPQWFARDLTLALSYAMQGESERARAAVAAVLRASPEDNIRENLIVNSQEHLHPAFADFYERSMVPALRMVGFPE